jgi:hypothetical protein
MISVSRVFNAATKKG